MSSLPTPPFPPQNRLVTLLIGMVVANLVGGALCFGVTKLSQFFNGSNEGWLIWPSFFLLPLLVGLVAAWFYVKCSGERLRSKFAAAGAH